MSSFICKILDIYIAISYIAYMKKSSSKTIRHKILNGKTDRLWTYGDFSSLPTMAVAATLSRLYKEGLIRRVRNGVYYRPRKTRFGESKPEPAAIAAAVLNRRGVSWKHTGLPAHNRLGLTTQLSPVTVFAVDSNTRSLTVGTPKRVRIRSVGTVKGISTEERATLDALRDLRWIPDTTPEDTFTRVEDLCNSGRVSYEKLVKAAKVEPPRVRALLGVLGERLDANTEFLRRLIFI